MQFDCARCEELLLDYSYGELDEVTAAAFRRHADSCARCGASLADVRVVREAFRMLPLETPSPTVDARILAAAETRLNELDDKKRALLRESEEPRSLLGKLFDVFRVVAVRPQYAMAVVLVLMVGVGLLVAPQMRMTEQAAPGVAPTLVGDRGVELAPVPASSAEPAVPAAPAPAPAQAPATVATATPGPTPTTTATTEEARPDAPAPADALARADEHRLEANRANLDDEAAPARGARGRATRSLEGDADGADAAGGERSRDRAAVIVAPLPARPVTRGGGGGGVSGGLTEDQDSAANLGFAQVPREQQQRQEAERAPAHAADLRLAEQPARTESRSYAPQPSPAPEPAFARRPAPQPSAPSARSYGPAPAPLVVAQQGQAVAAPGGAASAGSSSGDAGALERGMTNFRAGRYRQAIPDLEVAVARPGLTSDALATAHLAIARSYKGSGNCSEATRRYEDLMRRFSAYRTNADVNWEAAECYRLLGNTARADELYRVAERSARYGERARAKRVQMDGARRAAPAFDAAEAAEPAANDSTGAAAQ